MSPSIRDVVDHAIDNMGSKAIILPVAHYNSLCRRLGLVFKPVVLQYRGVTIRRI